MGWSSVCRREPSIQFSLRHEICRIGCFFGIGIAICGYGLGAESHQASGVKIGEVTDTTAIAWIRYTRNSAPNSRGPVFDRDGENDELPANKIGDPATFKWAAPGAPGKVHLRYSMKPDVTDAQETAWVEVGERDDFQHQFRLTELTPGSEYFYASETAPLDGSSVHAPVRGRFQTAPRPDQASPVTFALLNCQMFAHRDHPNGFNMYSAALALDPQFVVFTGDNVYYDRDLPFARSPALARFHWQRMYGLPRHAELLRSVGSYWMKDDHDTLGDDSWPGKVDRRLTPFTFTEGQRIFREQVPMGERTYRTFRWGRDLQIWLIEGRDFRSPNPGPDGPQKSILGSEQKHWLRESVAASDATWRILISPTPWVGPDRGGNKADNHADPSFHHESAEMLGWFRDTLGENFAIICGDRHWQYHSVHPQFGVHEFSIGPCSGAHAQHPLEDPAWHRFFRDKGGFASVSVARADAVPRLTIRLHETHGMVVYQWTAEGQ
ncbi:MAG: alkaline phosphatase D family protein [Pirellulales bacterium]